MTPAQEAKLDALAVAVSIIPSSTRVAVWNQTWTEDGWSVSALQALIRTYKRSVLRGDEGVSDTELESAVNQLIAELPPRTIALLKEKL